jgi:hypothetical protein
LHYSIGNPPFLYYKSVRHTPIPTPRESRTFPQPQILARRPIQYNTISLKYSPVQPIDQSGSWRIRTTFGEQRKCIARFAADGRRRRLSAVFLAPNVTPTPRLEAAGHKIKTEEMPLSLCLQSRVRRLAVVGFSGFKSAPSLSSLSSLFYSAPSMLKSHRATTRWRGSTCSSPASCAAGCCWACWWLSHTTSSTTL